MLGIFDPVVDVVEHPVIELASRQDWVRLPTDDVIGQLADLVIDLHMLVGGQIGREFGAVGIGSSWGKTNHTRTRWAPSGTTILSSWRTSKVARRNPASPWLAWLDVDSPARPTDTAPLRSNTPAKLAKPLRFTV